MKLHKYSLIPIKRGCESSNFQDYFIDSPNGSFAYGMKGSTKYFIKKLKIPTYPFNDDAYSSKVKIKMIKECNEFEDKQQKLLNAVKRSGFSEGNLVVPIDFFRIDASYYKVSKCVTEDILSLKEIVKHTNEEKYNMFFSLVKNLQTLHSAGIVHGDLKPENILVIKTSKGLQAKVIDFDDSYFEGEIHHPDDVVGTATYYSPELALYVENLKEGDDIDPSSITCKNDIFALGIIFHQYLTGYFPNNDEIKLGLYNIVKNDSLKLSSKLNENMSLLIKSMLDFKKENRPSTLAISMKLNSIVKGISYRKSSSDELKEDDTTPAIKDKSSISKGKTEVLEVIKTPIIKFKSSITKKYTSKEYSSKSDKESSTKTKSTYKYLGVNYSSLEELMKVKLKSN